MPQPRRSAESNRQRLQTSKRQIPMPLQIFSFQPQPRQAAENGVDCNLRFEPGERGANAIVQAMSEGEVPVRLSHEVELRRRFELLGIAIARRKRQAD